ncbi:MAG: PfkB protein [Thermoproteota archaeon]|nr:PfkB protein [Thermoproteota archaeon]
MKNLWPYVLPLPLERRELDRILQAVFDSKATLEVLKKTSPDKRTYQKKLISELRFSNKTVIEALKKLVATGVLKQGMEKKKEKGKTIWKKWYTPTFQGKWLVLLLQSPETVTKDIGKEIVSELFKIYIDSLAKLCVEYELDSQVFETMMNKAFLKVIEEPKYKSSRKSKVIVYGSSAVDTMVTIDRLPKKDESVYFSNVQNLPGGSASNVAIALRRLGVPVSFVGKVGGDAKGTLLLQEFKREEVDTSGVIIEPKQKTLTTFISIDHHGNKRIYVLGGDNIALSLSSPAEIVWNKIEDSQIIYIGEVFIEIAELIASFAKSHDKKVFYRPGLPIIIHNPEKVMAILRNVDVLILNQKGWENLKRNSPLRPTDILKTGPEALILTKGIEGCEVYTTEESFAMSADNLNAIDTTGAGDAFAAGLICSYLTSRDLKECIEFALAVSALSIVKKGAREALPTKVQVEEFIKKGKRM